MILHVSINYILCISWIVKCLSLMHGANMKKHIFLYTLPFQTYTRAHSAYFNIGTGNFSGCKVAVVLFWSARAIKLRGWESVNLYLYYLSVPHIMLWGDLYLYYISVPHIMLWGDLYLYYLSVPHVMLWGDLYLYYLSVPHIMLWGDLYLYYLSVPHVT